MLNVYIFVLLSKRICSVGVQHKGYDNLNSWELRYCESCTTCGFLHLVSSYFVFQNNFSVSLTK